VQVVSLGTRYEVQGARMGKKDAKRTNESARPAKWPGGVARGINLKVEICTGFRLTRVIKYTAVTCDLLLARGTGPYGLSILGSRCQGAQLGELTHPNPDQVNRQLRITRRDQHLKGNQ